MNVNEKNWLIRTRQNQILGPISKSKIIELLEKNSLVDDDELSSGNGYWFLVKEQDLMDKYIYGDLIQSFNPISEAENVLTKSSSTSSQTSSIKPSTIPIDSNAAAQDLKDDDLVPCQEDLEYPELEALKNTKALEVPKDLRNDSVKAPLESLIENQVEDLIEVSANKELQGTEVEGELDSSFPEESDLAYPELGSTTVEKASDEEESISEEESVLESESEEKSEVTLENTPEKKLKNKKNLIFVLFFLVFLGCLFYGVRYYYKNILNRPIPFLSFVITNANAGDELKSLSKKKRQANSNLSLQSTGK